MYIQGFGGPIGARLTMCVARLVLQEWSEDFSRILKKCNLEELLRAIYVDDSRGMFTKLRLGQRYSCEQETLTYSEAQEKEDISEGQTREKITEQEIRKIMNSINSDLVFTTETERDFMNKRLPTLGFEIWSEKNGLRHSFFEKPQTPNGVLLRTTMLSRTSLDSTMVQEGVKHLVNTSTEVPACKRNEIYWKDS